MISSITVQLIELDFEAFETRLRRAGIPLTVASRTASEYPGRPLPPQLEIGGRISKYEWGYRWSRGANGAILSIDALNKNCAELVRDLERAFPECKPITAREYPPVRMSIADRASVAGIIVILLLAAYGLWCLAALLIHHALWYAP